MNHNLLESIKILKRNKKYFASNDDYMKILTNLYNEISQKNLSSPSPNININELDGFSDIKLKDFTEDEKNKILCEILRCFNFESILKIKNINKLVLINPLFELLFIENKLIDLNPDKIYHIQTEPIFKEYNKNKIIEFIKVLLRICELSTGFINKGLICIIIFDELFKNFQFVVDHNKFAITVKNKLDEFKREKKKFDKICETYNLEKNIIDKWYEILNNINY